MKFLILLLLVITVSAFANAQTKTIRQYDRFENRTRYWTIPSTVRDGLDVAAHFSFKGQGAGHEIEGFYLTFQSHASDWRFLKGARLLCLIDGQSLDLGLPAARDNEVLRRYSSVETREILVFTTNLKVLNRIANAKSVEIRLGTIELTLDQSFRDALKELLGKVQVVGRKREAKQMKKP